MATDYFARWIMLPDGEILINGGIAVEGGRIAAVGPRGRLKRTSGDRAVNLGDILLLPGFINMHTHLEEAVLRGTEKDDEETFCSWITHRRDTMLAAPAGQVISSVRLAIRESLANGITTIVDTTQTDIPAIVLRDEPVRSWVFHESRMFGADAQEDLAAGLNKRIDRVHRGENTGLAPYALFSLSPRGHKSLMEMVRTQGYGWSCHVAESAEELQAFSVHEGELYSYVTARQSWPYADSGRGSMYYALTNNIIPQHGVCVHCNYMSGQELALLTARSASVVFCPQYNTIAGHKAFPLDVALNHGINA
jgi:cytosine/adenosine deaminase-related metal-dependent hydrolase